MNKLKPLILILFLSSFFTVKTNAQVYESGNFIADAYYGWPNLFTSVLRAAYETDPYFTDEGVTITSIGPLGARAEYLLSSRIGVGVNFNYASSGVKGVVEDYNSTTGQYELYDYKASIPRLRIMPTFNIHMGSSERLDPYFSFAAGYSSLSVKETTDAPNYQTITFNRPSNFAVRAEFGMRYFFTDNIGAHFQVGIGGGPLAAIGLSTKF